MSKKLMEIIKSEAKKKTTFTPNEYNELLMSMGFTKSALDMIFELTSDANYEFDGPNFHPLIYETILKQERALELINNIKADFSQQP